MSLKSQYTRHSGEPSIQLSPRGGKSNRLLSLWERIEVRVCRNPAKIKARKADKVRFCPAREILTNWIPGLTEGQPVLSLSKGRNDESMVLMK